MKHIRSHEELTRKIKESIDIPLDINWIKTSDNWVGVFKTDKNENFFKRPGAINPRIDNRSFVLVSFKPERPASRLFGGFYDIKHQTFSP